MSVDHTCKFPTGFLPVRSKHEKVAVLGEHDPPESGSSLQKLIVVPVSSVVFSGGQHVHAELS